METRIVGSSPAICDIMKTLARVAPTEKSILLLGETGTGKDLAARCIHELSGRRSKPFVALNCSTIPESLFEAELFGYRKGAFTGAEQDKGGLLDTAREGTAFLDEIGELPVALQAKLLRIIDKREFRPVGDTSLRRVETRFIFATNRDLAEEARAGRFRMDLYFRISVVQIHVPSLRERKEDIPLLADHFLKKDKTSAGRPRTLSREALKRLIRYDFPGNVRELENILERSALLAESTVIRAEDLRLESRCSRRVGAKRVQIGPEEILDALNANRWNITLAAKQLKASRRHLYRLMNRHGLSRPKTGPLC
jgi:transcriptional regulator with GAF, ATPase, and Fis domain